MNDAEYDTLYQACLHLDDGPDYRMNNYALNVINTALDFMSRVETVNSAMQYYSDNVGYKSHRKLKELIDSYPNTKTGNMALASYLWNNNMWTRAKFLRVLLNEFEQRGIRGQKSLTRWLADADFEEDIKGQFKSRYRNQGRAGYHSLGFALFNWLCLRCGIDTIKPDVHVINFVEEAIGRTPTSRECVESLTKIASEQNRQCYSLDSAIWHWRHDRKM